MRPRLYDREHDADGYEEGDINPSEPYFNMEDNPMRHEAPCTCGWVNDPRRATRLHKDGCARLVVAPPDLLAENERLRALLSRFTDEYQQVFKSIEDSPNYVWMMLPRELLTNIKAALAGGKEEK